jgi:6-phosphogluconolactonase
VVSLHESPDKQAAAAAAGDYILDCLSGARESQRIATLAVSGGSTPRLMFEHLANRSFDWEGIHLFWVDERCVPPDHADSNYRLTREALLEPLRFPDDRVHRIRGERRPEEAAACYADEIREFFRLGDNAWPRFDVVHLGMGDDGHTASLFPGGSLIHDRARLAAAIYEKSRQSHRVTLLPGVLLNAAHTIFLATGPDKARALRAVLHAPYDPVAYPAQVVARDGDGRRDVRWFIDSAAAAGIRESSGKA